MANETDPIVGNWYRHLDKGHRFEVVALDEDRGLVEIQHYDGDLEELELENWPDMELEVIESPEDWSGPVDDFEEGDLHYTETDMNRDDWRESLGEYSRTDSRSHQRSMADEFDEEEERPGKEEE